MKVGYYIHVVPGSLYFIISLLQFWGYFRHNYPKIHRLCGYYFFACQFFSTIGVIMFVIRGQTNGNLSSRLTSTLVLLYWTWTAYKAIEAIRIRDVVTHNIWMIRNIVIAYNVILTRPLIFASVFITISHPEQMEVAISVVTFLSILVCWLLGEIYIYGKYGEGALASNVSSFRSPQKFTAFEYSPKLVSESKAPHSITDEINSIDDTLDLISKSPFTNPVQPRVLTEWSDAMVISVKTYSTSLLHLTVQLRASPNPLLIPPGHHIAIRHPKIGIRQYTPISSPTDAAKGKIELLVSLQPMGKMSGYLSKLTTSSTVEVSPVFGSFISPTTQPNILLVAGGTGITPFMNLVYHLAPQPRTPSITLICASRITIPEFVETFFTKLADLYPNFKVIFVTGGEKLSKELVLKHCPDKKQAQAALKAVDSNGVRWTGQGAAVLVCGPKSMEDNVAKWVRTKGIRGALVWRFGSNGR
ncbi:hypothetical protein HK098_005345 [Nowakowskiella sp. JEL0407]|nr:hypothetical protein HK098_005345 [Nowakowskiella sp. JEL0407]